jgi:hypothetical protein
MDARVSKITLIVALIIGICSKLIVAISISFRQICPAEVNAAAHGIPHLIISLTTTRFFQSSTIHGMKIRSANFS